MLDVRTPIVWNKPKTKIYDYNQQFTSSMYQPMLEYVETKERQGVYFQKSAERIHLPEPAELALKDHSGGIASSGVGELERTLVKGFSNMARENNAMTVRAQNLFIRGSKDNTQLEAKLTSTMLRDKYIKELHIISSRK